MSLSQQVFNISETCLIWKHMVSHTFSSIEVKTEAVKDHCAVSREQCFQRLKIMVCYDSENP
jgi:hypothetical protein